MQSSYNGEQGEKGQQDSTRSCPEHPFRPLSHAFLSGKIAGIVLYLTFTLYLVFFGYQIADRGLDCVERRGNLIDWILLAFGYFFTVGCALLLPVLGYWLTFDGGIYGILG